MINRGLIPDQVQADTVLKRNTIVIEREEDNLIGTNAFRIVFDYHDWMESVGAC